VSAPLRLDAPAKINLYLHVLGKRPDGYHELDSLIVFAGVGDALMFEPGGFLELDIDGPFAAELRADDDNLVMKAARMLADEAEIEPRARITLTKNLPVASGIGGGSADAAATLKGLCELWRLSPPPALLNAMAKTLGADVPVCLESRSAYIGGVGEVVEPAPGLPAAHLVLVNPLVAVPTPQVFAARQGTFSKADRLDGMPDTVETLAQALQSRRNDLTGAAIKTARVIGDVLSALEALDDVLFTRLSGSGATCFALFAEEAQATKAADTLRQDHPDWWIAAAPILA
jgi:4-diphosphocytidyl-2-C-methyl-D-erythritol kinase